MRLTATLSLSLLACTLALGACKREPAGAAADVAPKRMAPADSPWQQAVDGFIAGWFQRNPSQAANAGKHEFDGKLPDWSPAGIKANI